VLYLICISVIIPKLEGHSHTEESTGNFKRMLKLLPIVQPVKSRTFLMLTFLGLYCCSFCRFRLFALSTLWC
jgi:hypothetical protein